MPSELYRGPFLLVALGLMAVEALYILYGLKRDYGLKPMFASMGVALGNILTRPLTHGAILMVFPAVSQFAPWHLEITDVWVWALGFVGVEFTYYWMHRLSHTVRWFWASHSVHHSSESFTLPSAIRLSWTTVLSGEWLLFLPMVLLGFPPAMIAALLAFNLVYQFFLHTELSPRWGVLEWVLNTPAHHRIHHASNAQYLDKNFGGVVIIFDRLFGTFARDDGHETVRFGLSSGHKSYNPLSIALGEWRRLFTDMARARSFKSLWSVVAERPK